MAPEPRSAIGRERLARLWRAGTELLGCRVESEQGQALGRIRDIWRTGAPDVLVIEDARGGELLVPAALLRRVDKAERLVVVELLPGLLPEEG